MSVTELLLLLLVAGLVGAVGRAITGYSRGGCLVAIAIGFVGALLGGWLGRTLGLPELIPLEIGGIPFPLVWSIIGAALFVALVSLISRRR